MLTNSSLPKILFGSQMHWAECVGWVELTGRGGPMAQHEVAQGNVHEDGTCG